MQPATTSQPKAKTTTHTRGALDRDRYCPQLQRLLLSAASELGHRGNLAQVVASIERGGSGGGAIDNDGAMVERLNRNKHVARQVRELEQRWRMLSPKHQTLALAHYVGTMRAHPTIRIVFGPSSSDPEAQQGSLAGVVLLRWQDRQARARERAADAGGAPVQQQLDALRAELAPLEREVVVLGSLLEQPLTLPDHEEPRPAPPELGTEGLELCLAARLVRRVLSDYHTAKRAWLAPVRFLAWQHQERRRAAIDRLQEIALLLPPLQAQQARLCAELAGAAATRAAVDDQEALVVLCRSGKLDHAAHMTGAEADVRALHRAWYATAKRTAKAWVEEGETAA